MLGAYRVDLVEDGLGVADALLSGLADGVVAMGLDRVQGGDDVVVDAQLNLLQRVHLLLRGLGSLCKALLAIADNTQDLGKFSLQ